MTGLKSLFCLVLLLCLKKKNAKFFSFLLLFIPGGLILKLAFNDRLSAVFGPRSLKHKLKRGSALIILLCKGALSVFHSEKIILFTLKNNAKNASQNT